MPVLIKGWKIANIFPIIFKKRNVDNVDEDDLSAAVEEEQWQARIAGVYDALDFRHPVTYQETDICQCVKDNQIIKSSNHQIIKLSN
jgi:hypothetical protein